MKKSLTLMMMVLSALIAQAQPDLKSDPWPAKWISVPGAGELDYGVYYFRKDVDLPAVPARYLVHVTGDNRYKLYVNEKLVSMGPAKGDAAHWNYETVDLAPYLSGGRNVIAALVYNEGHRRPDSQISVSTGFLLQGEAESAGLYTDKSWLCIQDPAYSPVNAIVIGYYVAGPGEKVDMNLTVPDWNKAGADLSAWIPAREGASGDPKDVCAPDHSAEAHGLVPSTLPQMERTPFTLGKAFTVPANTQTEVLLDNKVLTNAYFHLKMSGGKDAKVNIGYAESLYIPDGSGPAYQLTPEQLALVPEEYLSYVLAPKVKGKGNRNETEGKVFVGREDQLVSNGMAGQEYTTLSWRTFRYVRLQVETAAEPLVIEDVSSIFTGYPFTLDARLDTGNQEWKDMLEIGWRTARLCAWETYMDCPYYEQLQYLGDTRIQALVTLYNSKDDRLVRNFLHLADISRNADGITKSRYPTTIPQYIQPYSLSYIYALHDYMMYGGDTAFVMDLLPGAEQIMHYYSRFRLPDGRVKNLPGWNFSDWVNDRPNWKQGVLDKGADGWSILMDLQLLYAFQLMAHMEEVRGNTWQAGEYLKEAEKLSASVKNAYWNEARGLFADRAEQDTYSQHGNALAILCGIAPDAKALAQKMLTEKDLAQCTIYYKFYLHEAYVKAGLGDDYLNWLDVWRENMALGLTTWGEDADVFGTRSDCHAWGASPNIEFYRTVLGVDSDAVGFRRVKIEPHLGAIKEIGGAIPHPSGEISVQYKVKGDRIQATIELPIDVNGIFVWKGEEQALHGGKNQVKL